MPDWLAREVHYYSAQMGKVEWLNNGERLGQLCSIDRAYQMVETPYVFHAEEDWVFHGDGTDWLQESKSILMRHPEIIMVSLRGDTGWHRLIDMPPYEGFKICMPYWRKIWGGLAFNPGLRRMKEYRMVGSYGALTGGYGVGGLLNEKDISKFYLDRGFKMADLGRVLVSHTGGGRSQAITPLEFIPKILLAMPVCHKFDYDRWESGDSPLYDPRKNWENKPYGTDIHISGSNNRIAAVRDTWWADAKNYPTLTPMMFYGKPHPEGWEPKKDEVALSCPDDYGHLVDKTVEICRYARNNAYDFVFKCDDDTGVYCDRLVMELLLTRFDYAGFRHGGVATGGTGYWLSKSAFRIIADQADTSHWAEDVMVAKTLAHHNIVPQHLDGHRTGKSDHWFWKEGFDQNVDMTGITSFHAVRPTDMRAWHKWKEAYDRPTAR